MSQVIRHKLDTLTFGKHKGKTVRWIIEHDPSYIIWLHENKVCEIPDEFVDEAIDNEGNESLESDFEPNYV
jgi:hypothetical protein